MMYYIILRIPKNRKAITGCLTAGESIDDTKATTVSLYGINTAEDLEQFVNKSDVEARLSGARRNYGDRWDYEIMEVEL